MEHVLHHLRNANALVHRAGPYVLLEILLPGGTLFALLYFLYRRAQARGRAAGPLAARLAAHLEDALHLRVAGTRRVMRDGLEPLGFSAD